MATTTDTASPTPGNVADVADVADVSTVLFIKLADLDELVERGNQRQALRQARQLLDHTDGDTRAELADLVGSLEQQRDADWVPPQRSRPDPLGAAEPGADPPPSAAHPGTGGYRRTRG